MHLWSPDFPSLPESFLQSWSFLALLSKIIIPFWEPLFLAPKLLFFPNLNTWCAETQCVNSLLIAHSASINGRVQNVTLLFSSGVTKVYKQPVPTAARKYQSSASEFKIQTFTNRHTHMPNYLLPVSICSWNYSFHCAATNIFMPKVIFGAISKTFIHLVIVSYLD